MSLPLNVLIAAMLAGSGASGPLRYVTAGNQFQQTVTVMSGAILGSAFKDIHYAGGDINYLVIEHQNVALAQGSFSPFTIPELWITIDGQSTGYQVTWSGATTTTVPAGSASWQSDPIPIGSIPGNTGGIIPRGTKLWVGQRTEAAVNANLPGIIIRNPGTNQALKYTPGTTTINNLAGSSALSTTGGGSQASANQGYGIPTLIGRFNGGDIPVHAFIGDSLTMGYFSSAQTFSSGCCYPALFDNFATFSNPRPGIVIARVGSNTTDWTGNATVQAAQAIACQRANVFYERFGANFILADGGDAAAATLVANKKVIWDFIRAHPAASGRQPIIYALALFPHTVGPAFTGISGDGTTATITGLPTSFVSSIGTTGATKTGCGVYSTTPGGFNVNATTPATTTFTVASTTSVTYPNTTSGSGTVMGTVSDGFTTLTNQTPTPGCGQGQEANFVYTRLVAAAAAGSPTGPDFFVDDTIDVRGDTNVANANYWLWAINCTEEGLHLVPAGYTTVAARLHTTVAGVV